MMRLSALLLLSLDWAAAYSAGALSTHRQPRLVAPRAPGVVALDVGGVWAGYLGALEQAPLLTKAITAGVIIGAGDSTAQLIETDQDADFDWARSLRWAVFGLVLQGPWNHFFYQLLDGALPPTPDPFTLTTLEKVGIDQFVQAPIFTVIILGFFAVVEGKGLSYAASQIKNDLGGILIK